MQSISDELRLDKRQAPPADLMVLRHRYPPAQWPAHRNYGELAAFWLQVHAGLRGQGRVLAETTRDFREARIDIATFGRVFAGQLRDYLQHLEGHHRIEDLHYFPRFRALDNRLVAGFDLLENDHEIIHAQVLTVVESAQALLRDIERGGDAPLYSADAYSDRAERLHGLLDRHLDDEEALVIPSILEYSEAALR
ncbi:hypothetical protein S4A8_10941 [Salinisphaera sp. S4-8]|uniref:hemerythrin domain-containing protein n=1 Tax=Salinisphaera sp. S4-8 TaxID=633357 RepID=UPI00333E3E5F